MGHNSGWKPRRASDWIVMWEQEKAMYIPTEDGRIEGIFLDRVRRLDGEYADVLIKPVEGSRFYVRFNPTRVYRPLNLPLLVHPVEDGAFKGFWIMPGRRA
jgi:hypothetical protein